jgi:hypothetical protein
VVTSAQMNVLSEENIFRSDDFVIDFFSYGQSPDKSVACTFTPFTPSANAGAETLVGLGFGGELLLRSGFDVVAFKSAKNFWYQNLDSETVDKVEKFISARQAKYIRRVSYGSSMGAYAAIQFSRPLKLDVVLALSPQFEIDKPYDQRWQSSAQQIDFRHRIDADTISPECKYFVAYDPKNEDLLHVQQLRAIIDNDHLIEIQTPYSGHPAAGYLLETGLIQEVALSVLKNASVNHSALRIHRKRSKSYLYEFSRQLASKDKNRSALIAIDMAIGIDNTALAFPIHKSLILDQHGDRAAALKLAYETRDRLTGVVISEAHLMGALSALLVRYQDLSGALALINRAIRLDPSIREFQTQKKAVLAMVKANRRRVEPLVEHSVTSPSMPYCAGRELASPTVLGIDNPVADPTVSQSTTVSVEPKQSLADRLRKLLRVPTVKR